MANQTTARDDDRQSSALADYLHNGNQIYAGSLVTADTNGYAAAGTAGNAFLGVAMEDTPTTRPYIRVWAEGIFQFNGAGFTQADVGKAVIVGSDDNSVALATGAENEIVIGKIINFNSATSVRVKIAL